MLTVTTANLNGIRSAARKGFFDWFAKLRPDVLCIQETKAQREQLTDPVFFPEGYHGFFHDAEKKGYSGVALYSRREPDEVVEGVGVPEIDCEGRWVEARFGDLAVVSFYMPSGSSGDHRQTFKYAFMESFLEHLRELLASGRRYIICGDWNIAHTARDLKNWRSNQKNSGFLPEERAWMDRLFGDVGFVDAFRVVNDEPHQYTWWSFRGQAWANNTGWRIDYHVVSPDLRERVRDAEIYTAERFSDHAPLTMTYDLD
jgi:exodeoxyribonuclease-3